MLPAPACCQPPACQSPPPPPCPGAGGPTAACRAQGPRHLPPPLAQVVLWDVSSSSEALAVRQTQATAGAGARAGAGEGGQQAPGTAAAGGQEGVEDAAVAVVKYK